MILSRLVRATLGIALVPILFGAARGSNVPTNDVSAFRTFDLYADRTSSANVLDHLNVAAYPSYLQSTSLLVTRTPGSSDTVGLFNSNPYDGMYFEVNGSQPQSYAEYAVTPPQHATSLGFLVMGVNIYNSTGAFADFGKALLRATVTYEGGDTAVRTLHVGNHIRDYFDSGPLSCGIPRPLYTTRPSDPLSGYIYENGTYFYDVQEQLLPGDRRNKRLTSIRVDGLLLDHFCSTFVPHVYAGSRFFGLTAWPDFEVRNRNNQGIVLQTQNDPAWADSVYGGYVFNGAYVGFDRTMGALGCFEACLSMAHNYYGVSCTPQALNHWLQANRGFAREATVALTSVSGQAIGSAVGFRKLGKSLPKTGSVFLIEHGLYNPIVRILVTGPGVGQIAARHQAGTVAVDDIGYIRPGRRRIQQWGMEDQPLVGRQFHASRHRGGACRLLPRTRPYAPDGWRPSETLGPGERPRARVPVGHDGPRHVWDQRSGIWRIANDPSPPRESIHRCTSVSSAAIGARTLADHSRGSRLCE